MGLGADQCRGYLDRLKEPPKINCELENWKITKISMTYNFKHRDIIVTNNFSIFCRAKEIVERICVVEVFFYRKF
jgi:hypothetical protein